MDCRFGYRWRGFVRRMWRKVKKGMRESIGSGKEGELLELFGC
jgi:hypothetical protein